MDSENFSLNKSNNLIESSVETRNRSFKNFLLEQISLPKDKWSDEFKEYVEEKRREAKELENDESPDLSPEENQIKVFNDYLKDLCVEDDLEYFKDKEVIDLGYGEGEFVLECLKRGEVKSIYGLDLNIKKELSSGNFKDNFIEGDFTKELPFKNADRIISDGGVSALTFNENGQGDFEKSLRNSLDILTENGEIRIAPIHKYSHSDIELVGLDSSIDKLSKILEKLSQENLIDFKFEPIDIQVSGKDYKDIWLWETLIIKKKK